MAFLKVEDVFIVLCSSSGERALRWFFDVGGRGEMREVGLGGKMILSFFECNSCPHNLTGNYLSNNGLLDCV